MKITCIIPSHKEDYFLLICIKKHLIKIDIRLVLLILLFSIAYVCPSHPHPLQV